MQQCPNCESTDVQELFEGQYFCMDCEWDNIEQMHTQGPKSDQPVDTSTQTVPSVMGNYRIGIELITQVSEQCELTEDEANLTISKAIQNRPELEHSPVPELIEYIQNELADRIDELLDNGNTSVNSVPGADGDVITEEAMEELLSYGLGRTGHSSLGNCEDEQLGALSSTSNPTNEEMLQEITDTITNRIVHRTKQQLIEDTVPYKWTSINTLTDDISRLDVEVETRPLETLLNFSTGNSATLNWEAVNVHSIDYTTPTWSPGDITAYSTRISPMYMSTAEETAIRQLTEEEQRRYEILNSRTCMYTNFNKLIELSKNYNTEDYAELHIDCTINSTDWPYHFADLMYEQDLNLCKIHQVYNSSPQLQVPVHNELVQYYSEDNDLEDELCNISYSTIVLDLDYRLHRNAFGVYSLEGPSMVSNQNYVSTLLSGYMIKVAEQSSITSTYVTIDEALGAIHRAYDRFAEEAHVYPNDLVVLAQHEMIKQLFMAEALRDEVQTAEEVINTGTLYGAKLYTAKNMFDRNMMLILYPESIFMACKTTENMIRFSEPEFYNTHIEAIYLDN